MVRLEFTTAALALLIGLVVADAMDNAQRAATLMTVPVVITLDDATATAATATPTASSPTPMPPPLTPEQILDQQHPKTCLHWDSHWWPSFYIQLARIPESEIHSYCRGIWDNLHHRQCTVRGDGHYCGMHWGHHDTLYWEFDTYGSCSPYQVETAFYWATEKGKFGNVTCTRYEDSPSIRHWDEHFWGNDYWTGHKPASVSERAEGMDAREEEEEDVVL